MKDTLRYTIHKFYYEPDGDEETTSHNRFMECVLVFESEDEKEAFKEYVLNIWHRKEEYSKDIWLPHFSKIEGYIMEEFEKKYMNVQILKRMLVEFKKLYK